MADAPDSKPGPPTEGVGSSPTQGTASRDGETENAAALNPAALRGVRVRIPLSVLQADLAKWQTRCLEGAVRNRLRVRVPRSALK